MAEKKAGWTYDHSDILDLDFAYKVENGKVELWTSDKVKYTQAELEELQKHHNDKQKQVHIVKKLFKGVLL